MLDDVFEAVLLHLWNDEVANVRLTCMAWRAKTDSLLQVGTQHHPTRIRRFSPAFSDLFACTILSRHWPFQNNLELVQSSILEL